MNAINYSEDKVIKVSDYITTIEGFLSEETCDKLIQYFEAIEDQKWGFVAFYNSRAKHYPFNSDPEGLAKFDLPESIFKDIETNIKAFVEYSRGREVVLQSAPHIQKWFVGGFAAPHSDNSDFDGNYNGFQRNKCSSLIYLNDDYEGGEIFFPQHKIRIKPKKGQLVAFEGGHYNIHGVTEVTKGVRYTNGFFWDFADCVYTDEDRAMWESYMTDLKQEQSEIRVEWAKEMPE